MRSKAYSPVDNPSQNDPEDHEAGDIYVGTTNMCCTCLMRWLESQTRASSLILYAYLYWYLIIMFAFGFSHMTTNALLRACLLASFLSISLNAVHGHLCDIYAPLKVFRLWIIIFSVSSLSVVQCNLFSTAYTTYLIAEIAGVLCIILFGSLLHHIIVSKYNYGARNHQTLQQSSDSTRHSDESELSSLSPPHNGIQEYIDSDAD